jgi:hypothetical protein
MVLQFLRMGNGDAVNKAQKMAASGSFVDSRPYDLSLVNKDVILSDSRNSQEEDGSKLENQINLRHTIGDGEQYNLPLLNNLITHVQQQAAQIAVLENELGRRESKLKAINEHDLFQSSARQSSLLPNHVSSSFNPTGLNFESANSSTPETMLYVGKGFNTRFYGASNPLSIVSTSPAVLQNVSLSQASKRPECTYTYLNVVTTKF